METADRIQRLKQEAEKGQAMKNAESAIQAGLARIMNELEYMSMDIGRLDEVTHTVQSRPNETSGEIGMDGDGGVETWSPLQRQLFQINERIAIQRSQIRRIVELIEL